jgi:hypothetical protein
LIQYLNLFLDICFLRRGPQDVPASNALLGLTLAFYCTAGLLVFTVHGTFSMAVIQSVADVILLGGVAWLLLRFKGLLARFLQTFTALAGTGAVLGFIAWPVVAWLAREAEGEGVGIANLVFLALFGWSLVVMTHILREALEVSRGVAIMVVVSYLILSVTATNYLLASLG